MLAWSPVNTNAAMLTFLQIRNFAIVESLELDFSNGFTCITGETGAGKSILVDALGLLCGNRADSGAIREGARRAELVAAFELPADSHALRWLSETELDDGEHCLLRRVINDNGRSRAWINGTAVTLQQMAELGEHLVEIHGQNEHLRLVRSAEQMRLVDSGGSHDKAISRTREAYFTWHALEQEKQALLGEVPLSEGDLELMKYQVEELQASAMPAAEFTALENEHRKLARGGEILSALESALQTLQAEDSGAVNGIYQASAQLQELTSLEDDIAAAASMLNEAAINCDEAGSSIQAALSRLDLSPERFAELERQLAHQHDLARKHRAQPEQLEEVLQALSGRLELAASMETRLARIDSEISSALDTYRESARALHKGRVSRARQLAKDVSRLMQDLGMEGGQFVIEVDHDASTAPTARGDDRIAIKVSANGGTAPGPLRKVASGGELSRISLAVKVAARRGSSANESPGGGTQVFDEVDAGIGGETAHAVGALLKSLAANGQALCVTHLAQVAVFADRQLQVSKSTGAGGTAVTARLLDQDGRVDEVARMLGGQLSEQSRAHAAELLGAVSARRH